MNDVRSTSGKIRRKMRKKNAFTLIELLVVISIISLLSSVVLTSLQGARERAREAGILQGLNQARTQAEIHFNQNNTYSGLCDDERIGQIVDSLESTGDGAACWVSTDYYSGSSYRAELAQIDWGIGVKDEDRYFVGSPLGASIVADSDAGVGSANWDQAKAACAADGARLSSPSALQAIREITAGLPQAPEGFTEGLHWSAIESPSLSTHAYYTRLSSSLNISVSRTWKASTLHVRCVR